MEKARRTLADIQNYPTVQELHQKILSKTIPYSFNQEYYQMRDKALLSITYLLAARVSEVLRLERSQFEIQKNMIIVHGIRCSKRKKRRFFREEAFIPLKGERKQLGILVLDYLKTVKKGKLFKMTRGRAYQICRHILGIPIHWLRAYGEDYLYTHWKNDVLAVADYVNVEANILQQYIRRGWKKYNVF